MNWEDIEENEIQELTKRFYLYQAALIRTPLGHVGANNQPNFPRYYNKYHNEMIDAASSLEEKYNIIVAKAKVPEAGSFDPSDFLREFERQNALQLLLVQNNNVIAPPKKLDEMINFFTSTLRLPWH